MIAMYNGEPIFGPRGPSGPDGSPIGTVISYMGLTAPQDYLACDGAEYEISQYSELAKFFESQFGASNHFGGDGEATFAVPDLRNLFLRGYHGEAEERLSGEVGEKQEATRSIYILPHGNGILYLPTGSYDSVDFNADKLVQDGVASEGGYNRDNYSGSPYPTYYTSRPVNAAVLYCIKAAASVPVLEEYDTDDGWHVRKWSDGYVEMEISVQNESWGRWQEMQFATYPSVPKRPLDIVKDLKAYVGVRVIWTNGYIGPGAYYPEENKVSAFTSMTSSSCYIDIKVTGRWRN